MLVNASGDTSGLVPRGLNQVPQLRKSALCMKPRQQHLWGGRCGGDAGACMVASLFDCQGCSQRGLSFLSRETVFLEPIREGWGLRESGARFLVTFLLLACWGSTWLRSDFCSAPLTHWPLNYLLSRLRHAATTGRQGRSLQYGWHVPCFPSTRHM